MARRKNMSLDEKIEVTNELIDTLETKLKDAKKTLSELQVEKENEELKQLRDVIQSSGKTVDEAIELIQLN